MRNIRATYELKKKKTQRIALDWITSQLELIYGLTNDVTGIQQNEIYEKGN